MNYKSIREAREDMGLSMNDMADKLGIVRQTYAKMESNPDIMSVGEMRNVCSIIAEKFQEKIFMMMVNGIHPSEGDCIE